MPVLRFLTLLGCGVALVAGLVTLAAPAYALALALTAAVSAGVAMAAALLTSTAEPSPAAQAVLPAPAPGAPVVQPHQELLAELERHKALEHQLMVAKQEAEAATMAKGEFLATMSHEIRTPLNGIIPLLDLLMSTELTADQRDYLTTAFGSAKELLRIVDDILDYSKLDAQKLQLENVGINLRELTTGVLRLMGKSAEAKGLRLELMIEPTVRLAVRGDPVRLRQVLTNLISNAIKFTERGSITLHVGRIGETRTRNQFRFEVRDTGIGIAPEAATHLFQAFVQADTSTTRTFGGTGLGLAICKRIVTLMGGRIGVNSAPGKGSTFWFEVALDKALGDIEGRAPIDTNDLRVLLVTANAAQQRRLGAALKRWGMQFVHASNTQEALGRLRGAQRPGQRVFDLVLVDVASIPTTALALHRALERETRPQQTLRVYLRGEGSLPVELGAAGFHVLPGTSADTELHARLLALLDTPAEERSATTAVQSDAAPARVPATPAEPVQPAASAPPVAAPAPAPAPPAPPPPAPTPTAKPTTAPASTPDAPPPAPLGPTPKPVADAAPKVAASTLQRAAPAASASTALTSGSDPTVLLVEDNPVNRQVAQRLLSLAGIAFDSAENGKEALDKMNAGNYAAVLMDCQMPIMDGYTATRKRRQHEQEHALARTPIIAMTANAMLGDREKCLDAGMDDYMSKPLSRALLESTVNTWLQARATQANQPMAVVAAVLPATPPRPAPAAAPPPLVVTATGPALDAEILRELREIMGPEFVSLVQVFLEDAPLALERIRTLAAGPDLAAIAAPAHTLKSTSANLGGLNLSAQAKAMELDARQHTLRAAPARAAALAAEYERVAAALRREIAG